MITMELTTKIEGCDHATDGKEGLAKKSWYFQRDFNSLTFNLFSESIASSNWIMLIKLPGFSFHSYSIGHNI